MKRRVFQFWLCSYLIILFIPIMINVIVLFQSQSLLVTEVRRANDSILYQFQQSFDNQITDIRRVGTQLSVDPRVISFLNRSTINEADAKLSARDLIPTLRTYSIANGVISDFCIYLKKFDFVLTTKTFIQADLFFQMFYRNSDMIFDEWKQLVNGAHIGSFLNLSKDPKLTGDSLVYIQTLPIQEIKDAPATLVVLLNQERMKQAIGSVHLANEGIIYIIDKDGRLVMKTGQMGELTPIDLDRLKDQNGFFTQTLSGKSVAVSYLASAVTDWKYVLVIPTSIYSAKENSLKNLIYLSILLCFSLGGISTYWITRRNYQPIRKMVDLVSNKVKSNLEHSMNEFSILQSFMTESTVSLDESNRKIQEQHKLLRNHFLARLLKGRVDTRSVLAQALESFELQFETDRFAVILFQIEDYEPLFQAKYEDLDIEKKMQFVYLIVTNIIEEMVGRNHRVYSTEVDGMIACLVNVRETEENVRKELLLIAQDVHSFIQEKFYIHFSIGISDIHTLWSSIPMCYEEAVEALDYKLFLGTRQVIAYDVLRRSEQDIYYPLDTERQLINYMAVGNYDEATEVVHRIFMTNFSENTISIQLGKLLMFELVGTMLKAVKKIQLNVREIMVEKTDLIKQITRCVTFAEMEEEILFFLKSVCDYIQLKKKSHNSDLNGQIVAYIQSHLVDPSLSLTSISFEFGINASYLSKFFKEQTGENLVEFVNKRRVEQSKKLLTQTDNAINDIIEKLGFTNSNTFIRVFKKYEGITPGQYRQNKHK